MFRDSVFLTYHMEPSGYLQIRRSVGHPKETLNDSTEHSLITFDMNKEEDRLNSKFVTD
jgi:hypothetical protein